MKLIDSINWSIFLSSLLLVSIGVLVIYSTSSQFALSQFIFIVVGYLLFLFISQLDMQSLKNLITPLYIFTFFLLIVVLVLGFETRGSIRWIPLGIINIQPSEFAKPTLILMLSLFWTKNIPNWKSIFKSLLFTSPVVLLIFRQPDLGTSLTLGAIWLGILFASRISIKKILILLSIAFLVIPSSWFFLQDYQKQRITGFLRPEVDPLGQGYNLIQSTISVGSGQVWGRGLGRGTQSRLQFLPEHRTDFIFAAISEEMGLFGSILILLIYLYLLTTCLSIAQKANNKLSYLLIIGVFSMLLFQIVINIGMNIGILPITGITLPLISYGGSSLIVTLICLGLVSSVSRIKKWKYSYV